MAVLKQSIWTSTNCTESDAQSLANHFNKALTFAHKVEVVKLTDKWFMITGTVNAKATCDRIMKTMKEEAVAAQALETSAAKES